MGFVGAWLEVAPFSKTFYVLLGFENSNSETRARAFSHLATFYVALLWITRFDQTGAAKFQIPIL